MHATLRLTTIAALASVIGLGAPPAVADDTPETVVIVHPDRAEYDPDRGQLRALFTMRVTVWPDGRPARVFVLPDRSALHDQFCRERLGTYPYVLRSVWDRKIYTGVGLAPIEVRSEAEMQQKVLSTPGAIGYARVSDHSFLPDSLRELAARALGRAGG